MLSEKTLKTLEYDKIMFSVSTFAVLNKTKNDIVSFLPETDITSARFLLNKTTEAYKLLYTYSVSGIYYCFDLSDESIRVKAGGTLSAGEILKYAAALKSARIAKNSILSVNDDSVKVIPSIANRLFINPDFEKEVASKIISEDEISDNASEKLYSIRKTIRNLNAEIRNKLNSYMHGSLGKYVRENVVTIRQDRFVVPVKSEYRSFVKGFVHDQSSTGSTLFIEPEAVMELNNDLKRATFDEQEEIRRILENLTLKISNMVDAISYNYDNLCEIDFSFACAAYSFSNRYTLPVLNDSGIVDIKRGKHPLIAKDKVVPINVSLGGDYNFLLISGPNTGGKTVTLKIVGLFSLMAISGLYIPADDESKIAVFSGIYCDVGDEQSIENSLSTFSSHVYNLKYVLENADRNSLILLDEIGAGTDPEEGSALALAIIKKLIKINCFGVITTHYDRLKAYAENCDKIENASMQFDSKTLKPLYKLILGVPGSSNAIEVAKTLGIEDDVILEAEKNLSIEKIEFEKIIKRAEESRKKADDIKAELEVLKAELAREKDEIAEEKRKITAERERIAVSAKTEIKRIVADKLAEAEEIITELKDILRVAGLESREIVRAAELKNRLKNSKYLDLVNEEEPFDLINTQIKDLKKGDRVYVKSISSYGTVLSVKAQKGEVEVSIGNARTVVKISDVFNRQTVKVKQEVCFKRGGLTQMEKPEINVVGKTTLNAVEEVATFIDKAVLSGIEEVKIIHGVGTGALLKAIRDYLKGNSAVLEFRAGKYGEGENGVTIVKLK